MPEVPWGSLYAMSQNELLVLHNTLNGLLDKGFIYMSQSSAAAPVLFVKKPGGGLQFCMDYCSLNKITRKDCYPLPLIQETLNSISKAKFFTKLDVIATVDAKPIYSFVRDRSAYMCELGLGLVIK